MRCSYSSDPEVLHRSTRPRPTNSYSKIRRFAPHQNSAITSVNPRPALRSPAVAIVPRHSVTNSRRHSSEFFGNILKGKKDKVLIMADESATNGVVFHDAEIGANDDSKVESKTSALSQKLVALEKENRELVRENEVVKEIEEKLKKTIEKLENEKDELRKKVEKPGLENRALGSLAARASELEGELVWLQHNLINATYDLAETNYEVSQLKTVLEGSKTREEEKRSKLETVEGEKNMLITKLTNLESTENDLRSEVEAKQKEFRAVLRKCAILFNVDKRRKELRKLLDEEEKVKKELEEKLEKERVIRLK